MGSFNCFSPTWRKKKYKGKSSPIAPSENKDVKTLCVKLEHPTSCSETNEWKSSSFSVPVPFTVPGDSTCKIKVTNDDTPFADGSGEVDYEGGDEHDETLSMKRDDSDFDLQAHVESSNEKERKKFYVYCSNLNENKQSNDSEEGTEMIEKGHVSDPGTGKAEFWASPKLKRSCSDLLKRTPFNELLEHLPPSEGVLEGDATSPVSVMTRQSADKVMLKKHSSSQILPSGSRRLWWKLFLWSHRNMHRTRPVKRQQPVLVEHLLNQQGGYCSDTIETRPALESSKLGSPGIFNRELIGTGFSGMWPQNQWVAFPTESSSPLARVDEWVQDVLKQPHFPIENDDHTGEGDGVVFPPSPENGSSPVRGSFHTTQHPPLNLADEISHANNIIQSLNASSNVAHMTSIGLKVIPSMSHFCSLRSVNLSGNSIAHITPGSLPKSLHVLNLSRNKINTIEGLRELTRLRVLDLSYNRISRVGQGLSNCTLIKELYLSGNKISHVEGLHRLLKLTVLDLSFNKIASTKALGQLVANYNSLMAINLLGNPIQCNISDDQLRKAICSLLPKLAFLNKQAANPQKAREMGGDAVAKAVLSRRDSRRKSVKRVAPGSSSSSVRRSGGGGVAAAPKSRQRSRSRSHHHQSAVKDKTLLGNNVGK